MTDFYSASSAVSPFTAILWCLYPVAVLVIIELLLGGGFGDDNNDDVAMMVIAVVMRVLMMVVLVGVLVMWCWLVMDGDAGIDCELGG